MKQIQAKLSVHIHRVKLQVKFPCSLLACLKIDNEEVPFGPDVPLRLGEAYLEQSVAASINISYDSLKHTISEKKVTVEVMQVSICVFLTTTSGRIPAGTAYINTSMLKKGANKDVIGIDKCPDKNAYIETVINFQHDIEGDFATGNGKQLVVSEQLSTFREKSGKSMGKQAYNEIPYTASYDNSEVKPRSRKGSRVDRSQLDMSRDVESYHNASFHSGNYSIQTLQQQSERYDYSNFSPPTNYNSRSKYNDSERELKNVQKKYEQVVMDLKGTITKKEMLEKSLKEVEAQAKLYKQKYEDIEQSIVHIQKRAQFKESSCKDQIKILTDKLASSENQKQMMIFEKNDLVTEFEEREKSLRAAHREKQKTLSEQRNKLAKRNEQLMKELSDLQGKSSQGQLRLAQLVRDAQNSGKNNGLLDQKYQNALKEVEQWRQLYSAEKLKRQDLQQFLSDRTQIEEEKKKLKKKIVEGEEQISKLLKNITSTDSNLQKALKKSEETELTLKQKIAQVKALQKEIDSLTKQRDALKKLLQEKEKKLQQANQRSQSQSQRIDNMNEQLLQLERRYLQEAKGLRKDIKDKEAQILKLNQQIDNNTNAMNDFNNQIKRLQVQIENFNKRVNNMGSEYDDVLQEKANVEEELVSVKKQLADQKESKEQLQSTLKQQLRERQKALKQLQSALSRSKSSASQKEEEDAFKILVLDQKIANLQAQIQQKVDKIESMQQTINILEKEKAEGHSSSEELECALRLKDKQIGFLKETIEKNSTETTEHIKGLQGQLDQQKRSTAQMRSSYEDRLRENQQIQCELQESLAKSRQINEESQEQIADLKGKLELSEKEVARLESETNELKEMNSALSQELSILNSTLEDKSSQNSTLKVQIQDLNQNLKQQQEEYSMYQSRQSSKFEQEATSLKVVIGEMQEKAAAEAQKYEELNYHFVIVKTELANLQTRNSEEIKKITAFNEKLSSQKSQLELIKAKLEHDIDIANAVIEVKVDTQSKLEDNLQELTQEKESLNEAIRLLEDASNQQQRKIQAEIEDLTQANNQLSTELQQTKEQLQEVTAEYTSQMKNAEQIASQLNQQISTLTANNRDLEAKIALNTKTLSDLEKTRAVEDQFIKPIRDNLQQLRGHMAEYSRTGDQFQSNKNKLLKAASIKVDFLSDKYVQDRMKDFSFAFSKFKVFILEFELSQERREKLGEEIRKVQVSIDRVLRGER